jgi:hypothetical protein
MAWSTNPITGSKSVPAQLSTTSVREQRGGSEVGRGFGLDDSAICLTATRRFNCNKAKSARNSGAGAIYKSLRLKHV